MNQKKQGPLYQRIVEDVSHRLKSGEFRSGDRLYSVNEMQEHFNVSSTTAVRAIEELKILGLVESIRGKGTFFKGISSHVSEKYSIEREIKKITLLVGSANFFKAGFQVEIFEGIEYEAEKAGLQLDIKKIPSGNPSQTNQLIYEPSPDEGIVLISSEIPVGIYPILRSRNIRTVLIDTFVPGVPSVCTDNYDGINQLVNYLKKNGHKKIALGHSFAVSPNHFNENERLSAFSFIAENTDIDGEVFVASRQEQILKRLKSKDGPTAVIFTQDIAANEFYRFISRKRVNVPGDFAICGFDGWMRESEQLADFTTLDVDRGGLGCSAVKTIIDDEVMGGFVMPAVRVKGSIKVGVTT
ncbi:MAG: GntR family transcriptional regulator [Planctomycetota bacterium]|jgi:DNA-binding LacI/PurR family transcriptional regulator